MFFVLCRLCLLSYMSQSAKSILINLFFYFKCLAESFKLISLTNLRRDIALFCPQYHDEYQHSKNMQNKIMSLQTRKSLYFPAVTQSVCHTVGNINPMELHVKLGRLGTAERLPVDFYLLFRTVIIWQLIQIERHKGIAHISQQITPRIMAQFKLIRIVRIDTL